MAGRKRSQTFLKRGSIAARPAGLCIGVGSPLLGGSKSPSDDERMDLNLAALTTGGSESRTASGNPIKGENKSINMSNVGRFVAIRGTGSNAPASAGGHDLRPAWSCAERRRAGGGGGAP